LTAEANRAFLVEVTDLNSGYGNSIVLRDVTMRAPREEITNMDEPEFNTILKKIGVLFQNSALLNSIPILDNIAIPLEQHTDLSGNMIRRLVDIKLRLVGLGDAKYKMPSELSGGMRKRAALARAIALDPPLLFCDEPSAGLDPVTAEGLDRLILRMRDELGMTVVLVSHTVSSIRRIADNLVYLDHGRVLFHGSPKAAKKCRVKQIEEFFDKG